MPKTLQNGSFKDANGIAVANGTLVLTLSQDAQIIAGGQVNARDLIAITLDSTGNVTGTPSVYGQDELSPGNTFYFAEVLNSGGSSVWGQTKWVFTGASPINLNLMVPTLLNPDPAYSEPILKNPTADQHIRASSLIMDVGNILPATGNTTQTLGSAAAPWNIFATAVTLSNSVIHVGGPTSGDIGTQINSAYAALPATGGTIIIDPHPTGGNYNFSTPIIMATAGKYVRLIGSGASGATGVSTIAGALNYTPVTATSAITLDYALSNQSAFSGSHGLSNVTFINNGIMASGGGGSSAIGISIGTTNGGVQGARMSNVAICGFGTGLSFLNDVGGSCCFFNPQFFANTTAIVVHSTTGLFFIGGAMAANGTVCKASSTSASAEMTFEDMQFFSNTTGFDFTASSGSPLAVDFIACHLENSPSLTSHFIQGNVDIHMNGGLMIDDNAVGTADWFINSGGNKILIEGVTFQSARTVTTIIVMNSPTRAFLSGHLAGGTFTNLVTGANAANATIVVSAGSSAVSAKQFVYESAIKTPTATLTAVAPTVAASQVGLGATTAATATAGGGQAVPATVTGYLIVNIAGTVQKIPYFNT